MFFTITIEIGKGRRSSKDYSSYEHDRPKIFRRIRRLENEALAGDLLAQKLQYLMCTLCQGQL